MPGKRKRPNSELTIVGGAIVVLVTFFFSKCPLSAQPTTIILGLVNAAVLYFYNYFLLKGSLCGPYSVLTVFGFFGSIIIPAAVKRIGFGITMTGPAIVFAIIILIAVYLMSKKPKDENTSVINEITPTFLLF